MHYSTSIFFLVFERKLMLLQRQTYHVNWNFRIGLFFTHLEAPWSPQIPGCSSSSPSPGCFELAEPPSPTGPFHHLSHGSSPAAHDSNSPAGSSTWPFLYGSSATLLLCLTLHAGGRWPLPTVVQQRQNNRLIWILLLLIQTACVSTAYLILQLDNFVIWGLWVLAELSHIFKLLL